MLNTIKVKMMTTIIMVVAVYVPVTKSQGGDESLTFEQLKSGEFEGIIHCTGPLWNIEEHDGYLAAFPTTRSFMVRHGLNLDPSPRFTFEQILAGIEANMDRYSGELPLLSISFDTKRNGTPVGLDPEVVAGQFDDQIAGIARLVKSRDVPVFIRIGPEFNGYWNGYSPGAFPAAFRRIVSIFKDEGAANAIFMWNYKAVLDENEIAPYIDFYPGDDVVDWWSIDLFSSDFLNPVLRQKVMVFLADAAARGKPVIIPESAPSGLDIGAPMESSARTRGNPQSTWENWFVPYFDLINADPNIKGFCYSNRDFFKNDVKLRDWGNLRIDQSPLKSLYQEELMEPQYIHQP